MKREELTLDDGLLCLSINGIFETIFNPSDFAFIGKIADVFDTLDARQGEMEAKVKAAEAREIFSIVRDADGEMRGMLDGILGDGACLAIFGDMNVYSYVDGLPAWSNLLLAILDRCEADLVANEKRTNPRLQKYADKYGKKK